MRVTKRYNVSLRTTLSKVRLTWKAYQAISAESKKRRKDVDRLEMSTRRERIAERLLSYLSKILDRPVTLRVIERAKKTGKFSGFKRVTVSRRSVSRAHILFQRWYVQGVEKIDHFEKSKNVSPVDPESLSISPFDVLAIKKHNEKQYVVDRGMFTAKKGKHEVELNAADTRIVLAIRIDGEGNEKRTYKHIERSEDKVTLGIVHRFALKLVGEYIQSIPSIKAKFSVVRDENKQRVIRGKRISKVSSADLIQDASLAVYEAILKGETSIEGLNALAFQVVKGSFLNRIKAESKIDSLNDFQDVYIENVDNMGRELPMFEAGYIKNMVDEGLVTA